MRHGAVPLLTMAGEIFVVGATAPVLEPVAVVLVPADGARRTPAAAPPARSARP